MQYHILYDEQQDAFEQILHLIINEGHKVVRLKAPAGTGKTVTLRAIGEFLKNNNLYMTCMTVAARAATHLSKSGVIAGTCHSFLYTPMLDGEGNLIRFERKTRDDLIDCMGDVCAVDEASMVNYTMYNDIISAGVPVILCGDYDQLEPINDVANGDDKDFNPMETLDVPTITLTKIRRFDESSGIGFLCAHLRNTNSIPRVKKQNLTMLRKAVVLTKDHFTHNNYEAVICGLNKTRKSINRLIRNARGFNSEVPDIGETVICLKNNVINKISISNGERFIIDGFLKTSEYDGRYFIRSIDRDGINLWVNVANDTWETEEVPNGYKKLDNMCVFGFGYALSAHKAQGSSFDSVLFIDEDVSYFLDQRRYRYTGCSRAMTNLVVAI